MMSPTARCLPKLAPFGKIPEAASLEWHRARHQHFEKGISSSSGNNIVHHGRFSSAPHWREMSSLRLNDVGGGGGGGGGGADL